MNPRDRNNAEELGWEEAKAAVLKILRAHRLRADCDQTFQLCNVLIQEVNKL